MERRGLQIRKDGWKGTGQAQLLDMTLSQRLWRCRSQISQLKKTNRIHREKVNILKSRLDNAICSSPASIEEEVLWEQKSRIINMVEIWRQITKHFHEITKAKRNRNNITAIQNPDGVIQRGQQNIAKVA